MTKLAGENLALQIIGCVSQKDAMENLISTSLTASTQVGPRSETGAALHIALDATGVTS